MRISSAFSRKTLPRIALLAAGTLAGTAAIFADDSREQISVETEDELRAALAETYLPDDATDDSEAVYHDDADVTLAGDIYIETLSESDDSAGTIDIYASGVAIDGNGCTISSSATDTDVAGSGDLFFLTDGVSLSISDLTITGTTDETLKTGRAFITGNSASSVVSLTLGAGTTVENRRLVSDDSTTYLAHGGALVSALITDEIYFTSSADGDVTFNGNTAISADDTAAGGAVFASGLLQISGAGTTLLSGNSAVSEAAEAFGGAIFISNANLNADGSSGSTTYTESVVDESGLKKFGLQIADTTLTFSGNSASGATQAAGGALAVSGGYVEAAGAEIVFEENFAETSDDESTALGGAMLVTDSAIASFDADTTLTFSGNSATAEGETSAAAGGALAVADSTLTLAGTTVFDGNSASAAGTEGIVYGGALYVSGEAEDSTDDDGNTVTTYTTNVALAGTLTFSANTASASGLDSTAAGGAVFLGGGSVDGAEIEDISFAQNSAESKTAAAGGAIASLADDTVLALASAGTADFSENSAKLLALEDDETQSDDVSAAAQGGALYIAAGTLEIASAGTVNFSGNSADATAQESASAQGGALFQSAGTLTLGAADFSSNSASADTSAGTAQGGAAHFSGSETAADFAGTVSFSGNSAGALTALGGALYTSGGTQNFAGTASFSGNSALGGSDEAELGTASARGGAIFAAAGSTLNFSAQATFEDNLASATTAAESGDSSEEADSDSTDSSDSSENSATDAASTRAQAYAFGGAVYSAGTLVFADDAETTFSGNAALVYGDAEGTAGGGALYVASGTLTAGALAFSGNSAGAIGAAHGGAFYLASAARVAVSGDISFTQNSVSGGDSGADASAASGGALYSAGTLIVSGNLSASGNSAEASDSALGGAIAAVSGSVTISGDGENVLSDNSASATGEAGTALGGALYAGSGFTQSAGTFTFSGNSASATGEAGTALGGALYVNGGDVTLTGATFENNSASATGTDGTAHGGAIYIDAGTAESTLTLAGNTVIAGNSSSDADGTRSNDGIYIGTGTTDAADATGSATLIFQTSADETEDEETGETTLENVETAEISDAITVDGATATIRKEGEGELVLAEISAENDAQLTLEFAAGTSTLNGDISEIAELTVESGATVELNATLGGYASATIAGTLNVNSGATYVFADGSETALTGTLAFLDGATASIAGAATVSGSGTLSAQGAVTFTFEDSSASLLAETLSVGAGTLTLSGAGTLSVTENLIFTESGDAVITLSEGETLELSEVSRTADEISVTIDGTGTLVLYKEASDDDEDDDDTTYDEIAFSEFYESVEDDDGNTSDEVRTATFTVGENITIATGIEVGDGVTFSMTNDTQQSGSKNIWLSGGTLLAPGTSEDAPLEIEALRVLTGTTDSDAVSVLGAAGEGQVFKMVGVTTTETVTETDDDGNETETEVTTTADANAIAIYGTLEITESTLVIGDVSFAASGSELTGEGTLRGDISVSGSSSYTGTVSIATVDGSISVSNGQSIYVSGTVSVSGDIDVGASDATSTNARFYFTDDAVLTVAGTFSNYGRTDVVSGNDATFSGTFVNYARLRVLAESSLTFADGTFTSASGSSIDISAENSSVTFAAGSVVIEGLENTTVYVDATALSKGDALAIYGLTEDQYASLAVEDSDGVYDLSDRFVYDSETGTLNFLGLNGEKYAGTLYADLQRESMNRTHEFLRAALFRGSTRPLVPELYGEYKLDSPYMRGYLEKMRQRGGDVSAEAQARHADDLALAQKLNSPLSFAWAQADFSMRHRKSREGMGAYDTTTAGMLVGFSVPTGKWEWGATLSGAEEVYDLDATSTASRHKVTSDTVGLAGYGRYENDWFDWSFGAGGMYVSADSERGDYDADFDLWRLGAMSEVGVSLRARNWFALRLYLGISFAFSYLEDFEETGGDGSAFGDESLDVDDDAAFSMRTNLGLSTAFALSDSFQFKVFAAWVLDVGNNRLSVDALMPSTDTDYVLRSRKYGASALETGATLNWTLTQSLGVYGGYTATIREGERAHALTLGVNYFF